MQPQNKHFKSQGRREINGKKKTRRDTNLTRDVEKCKKRGR